MHNFSRLAIELNEPEEGVAPTDSRLRPDQRLMEIGKWDESNSKKVRDFTSKLENLEKMLSLKMHEVFCNWKIFKFWKNVAFIFLEDNDNISLQL